jgi:iron(III) transport system substrate-binding protein
MTIPSAASPPRARCSLLLLGLLLTLLAGCPRPASRVVLYCAQDQEFAADSLATFHERTGIEVSPKFDTEKDKSVSLYMELVDEKNRPRCDVFWNNEILSTIRLQRQGMLLPYPSPSAAPYPAKLSSSDDTWHAFAARARVLLVNTKRVPEAERPKSLLDLTGPRWKGRVAMARPQFGTSATQAACLFQVLGPDKAKQYYTDLHANGVQVAPGNKQVAEWVGEGRADVGLTDTDDALEELEAHPEAVAMIFPDRDRPKGDPMGTLFIPNTVAILRGSPNPEGARKLVDYLLSAEIETKLAEAASHQIPLNPQVKAKLPKEMETPQTIKEMDVDFGKAADLWEETQTFLRNEFAR